MAAGIGIAMYVALRESSPALAAILLGSGAAAGVYLLASAGLMIWGSRVGKVQLRDEILDGIPWSGGEQVLDIGCGRGLFLIGAAKRLTTGRAIGVDIWASKDLSGNTPSAPLENARAEGVADRIEVRDADARELPFAAASFDVVLSSLTLHNITQRPERDTALREIIRVLRPGGYVAIFDLYHTRQYADLFRENGFTGITVSRLYALWWFSRWMIAMKPAAPPRVN